MGMCTNEASPTTFWSPVQACRRARGIQRLTAACSSHCSGVDLSGHRSQPASPALTQDADLVIAMSERQRDWLSRSVAGLHARCFTFKELARLANDIDPATLPASGPARIQQAVAQAHHRRPVSIAPPDQESIADPYGGTHEGYVAMANELVRLAAHVMPILLGDRQR